MAKVDYPALADDILVKVGGAENVENATHCITRLRLRIRDLSKVDKQGIGQLPGVITVVEAGGQFQVVIGDNGASSTTPSPSTCRIQPKVQDPVRRQRVRSKACSTDSSS